MDDTIKRLECDNVILVSVIIGTEADKFSSHLIRVHRMLIVRI